MFSDENGGNNMEQEPKGFFENGVVIEPASLAAEKAMNSSGRCL